MGCCSSSFFQIDWIVNTLGCKHSAVTKVQLIMSQNRKVTIIPVSEHNVNEDNRNALVTFQEDKVQMNSNGTQGSNVHVGTSLHKVSYE